MYTCVYIYIYVYIGREICIRDLVRQPVVPVHWAVQQAQHRDVAASLSLYIYIYIYMYVCIYIYICKCIYIYILILRNRWTTCVIYKHNYI